MGIAYYETGSPKSIKYRLPSFLPRMMISEYKKTLVFQDPITFTKDLRQFPCELNRIAILDLMFRSCCINMKDIIIE